MKNSRAYETLPLVSGRKSYETSEIEIYETSEIEFFPSNKIYAYLMDALLDQHRIYA